MAPRLMIRRACCWARARWSLSPGGQPRLSWLFVLGFTLIYSFWFLYGLRFHRLAIWVPNAIAVVLQFLLAAGVALKAHAG